MSDARDRLLTAIRDCDAERWGGDTRQPNDVLTDYVVVYAWRRFDGDPEGDADQISRLTRPGMALWQTAGLLSGALDLARDQMLRPENYGDDDA